MDKTHSIKNRISGLLDTITSTKACILMSASMAVITLLLEAIGGGADASLILVRSIFAIILFAIALLTLAEKKQSLFLICVIWGVMCFFLSNMWSACNYIWIHNDSVFQLVESLSEVGFLLFLYTASFGALDSLADDGSAVYRKYRLAGMAASLVVTVTWIVCFVLMRDFLIIPVGISLSLAAYIAVKHLIIPDIEDGFITPLKHYNMIILLVVVIKLVTLALTGYVETAHAVTVLKTLSVAAAVWIVPMARKGVSKW